MRAVLKKCWSSHNKVRTERVEGVALALPTVDEPFTMIAPPLEAGDYREVVTSPVLHTRELSPRLHRFYTYNSVYEVEILATLENASLEGASDV